MSTASASGSFETRSVSLDDETRGVPNHADLERFTVDRRRRYSTH
ncbi:hypothetical protein [Natrinema soli]|uniref:Uncharacterized protein n=1 Tax=Natrinema soli TaxID=1930624 RepID=A0ABD5SMJ8_9EURY|nr:hypothetical protein [Natrinema soli]